MKAHVNNVSRFLLIAGILLLFCVPQYSFAQRGIGVRFITDFDHFFRSQEFDVVDGWWSAAGIGAYYQVVFKHGGFRAGINVLGKPAGRGLPVVMQNFSDDTDVGFTMIEGELRVGPRFKFFNPQLGFIFGYYITQKGFLEPGSTESVVPINLTMPFGGTFEWPTGYGSVGFGLFYNVGLTNVMRDPTPGNGEPHDGSKLRTIRFEINTLFSTGKQAKKKPPAPKPFEEE